MIKAVLVFNNYGVTRLSKFFQHVDVASQSLLIKEIFSLVSERPVTACNFLEGSQLVGGSDTRIIYRHYATLYFVFVVDSSESDLGMLDLIQTFVEVLDKCFENVCELDLIFHSEKAYQALAEIISGGLVFETNRDVIEPCLPKVMKKKANLSSTYLNYVEKFGAYTFGTGQYQVPNYEMAYDQSYYT